MAIYDVIIIGAGASGLFCSAVFSHKKKGLLLEKTKKPAAKLLLSGSGQCNLTHDGDIRDFVKKYGEKGNLLRPALYQFSNHSVMEWFRQGGIPLTVREDGKVFPASFRASDIASFLLKRSMENGFEPRYLSAASEISYSAASQLYTVKQQNRSDQTKYLVIACGGSSYPATGSDGSFLEILTAFSKGMGNPLEIVRPRPALTPVFPKQYPYGALSGLSFPYVSITLQAKGLQDGMKREIRASGSLLFTHHGFSGPVILDHSRYLWPGDLLTLSYLPGIPVLDMERRLKQHLSGNQKQAENALHSYLNHEGTYYHTEFSRRFVSLLCQRCGIDPHKKSASLSGSEIRDFLHLLTEDTFTVEKTGGFQTAMATAGGVSLNEINLKTMECKKYPRLFLIGEILDVDGDTGGYNLQFAFSSGYAASAEICRR